MLATHALLARNLRNRPYGEIATAAAAWGLKIDTDLTVGISIPVVAVLVARGLRRVHRLVMHQHS